jgi:hypothetical protein
VDQVIDLMYHFPIHGYLRVQLLLATFSHIIDLENLHLILDQVFTPDEHREVSNVL